MSEFKFVLKCMVFTMLLVMLMQVKVGRYSIENHTYRWLRTSKASEYVQSVAAGGAMAIRNLAFSVKTGVSSTVEGFQEGAHDKAVR